MQYQHMMQQMARIDKMLAQFQMQQQLINQQNPNRKQAPNNLGIVNQSISEIGGHLSATQNLRQKFLTSPFNVMHKNEDQCLRNFCAALI